MSFRYAIYHRAGNCVGNVNLQVASNPAGKYCREFAVRETGLSTTYYHAEYLGVDVDGKLYQFSAEYLGVDCCDYFQGYGLGRDDTWDGCTYGTGNTEKEALDDAIDMLVAFTDFEITEEMKFDIRTDFGDADDLVTAASLFDGDDDEENVPQHFVGIKWRVLEGIQNG